jgi:hypothetical protein
VSRGIAALPGPLRQAGIRSGHAVAVLRLVQTNSTSPIPPKAT